MPRTQSGKFSARKSQETSEIQQFSSDPDPIANVNKQQHDETHITESSKRLKTELSKSIPRRKGISKKC